MSRDTRPIDKAFIYENDQAMSLTFTDRAHRNFQRRLRRRGFKLAASGYFYYHPKHWREVPLTRRADFWIYEDQVIALTREAKRWLKDDGLRGLEGT